MLNFSFSKIISSRNNIYYADYLMKYKIPKKLKRKRNYSGFKRGSYYQINQFKKRKTKKMKKAAF